MKRCYYEVLSVEKTVDEEGLKKAYRTLAMKFHPDRNPGDAEADAKFKEAAEAFDVLRDPQKRARYDRYGHAGLDGMPSHQFQDAGDVMDLFAELFGGAFGGGGGGGRRRGGRRRGNDLQVVFEIDLVDAYRGVERSLKIPRQQACDECKGSGAKPGTHPVACKRCNGQGAVVQGAGFFRIQQTCPTCQGRGEVISDPCRKCSGHGVVQVERELNVKVPPGIDENVQVRVTGEGEAGEAGVQPGDLYYQVRIRPHPIFAREGNDLHCEVPITFSQAALGGALEVPTLEGKFVNATLARGTQAGDEIRLSGRGMPHVRGGRGGDLVVHLRVITPRKLTQRQEELLRELSEIDGKHVSPERKTFMDRVVEFFGASKKDDEKKS